MRIGVVGVCGSGKSSLVRQLNRAGYDAHEIAQEHSYVPDMWQRIHPPDVLVYLDASYETVTQRRPNSLMTNTLYEQMLHQLRHAREHADLVIATDHMSEEESFMEVASYLTLLHA
jgi:deoxyadenosine/deoxycytidine kinase